MNKQSTSDPSDDAMLSELAAIGLRAARIVARMMEIEQTMADVAAAWLPAAGPMRASQADAVTVGQAFDAVDAAMALVAPRVAVLAGALERVSRSVRRSLALRRRIAAGWPRVGSDDQAAMVRRQVARGVGEAITRHSDGEAAERLFDELAERLDDPGLADEIGALPVEQVVRRICRDMGLAADDLKAGVLRDGAMPSGVAGAGPGVRSRLDTG